MTTTGAAVPLPTRVRVGEAVTVPGTTPGQGVIVIPDTGGHRTGFGDLVDVDAPADQLGLLERQGDGKIRAVARDEITTEWYSGTGPPPQVLVGAKRGDMYLDLDTGQLYQLV